MTPAHPYDDDCTCFHCQWRAQAERRVVATFMVGAIILAALTLWVLSMYARSPTGRHDGPPRGGRGAGPATSVRPWGSA